MPPSLSSTLPILPIELKKEILKFCDQPTLAKTSGLSLAFLQLSSPLLYRHITFEGSEGLVKFVSLVAEKRHPELEPWLDLSLIHSVALVDSRSSPNHGFKEVDGPSARRLHLPSSSKPGQLALHTLQIILTKPTTDFCLFSLFNPVVFKAKGHEVDSEDHLDENPGSEVTVFEGMDLSGWSRLQELIFEDAFVFDVLYHYGFDSFDRRFRLSYDTSVLDEETKVVEWIAYDLLSFDATAASQIESVVASLFSVEQRDRLLKLVTCSSLLPRLTVLVKSSTETTSLVTRST
ncbi:hypothetical protein BDY24DRAFT_439660 [Mrakia frigida]|uniref:uncharacterized protein n=1 Tax=Mrakia frigida TaxID=29902 RepID=UPI003FCC09F6